MIIPIIFGIGLASICSVNTFRNEIRGVTNTIITNLIPFVRRLAWWVRID